MASFVVAIFILPREDLRDRLIWHSHRLARPPRPWTMRLGGSASTS
jgi:hypothetical protein